MAYQDFENIDFVDEGGVVFDLSLLNGFDREKLLALSVLGEVDHAEASIGQLFIEVVLLLNVALVGVNEHLGRRGTLVARRARNVRNRLLGSIINHVD